MGYKIKSWGSSILRLSLYPDIFLGVKHSTLLIVTVVSSLLHLGSWAPSENYYCCSQEHLSLASENCKPLVSPSLYRQLLCVLQKFRVRL